MPDQYEEWLLQEAEEKPWASDELSLALVAYLRIKQQHDDDDVAKLRQRIARREASLADARDVIDLLEQFILSSRGREIYRGGQLWRKVRKIQAS